MKKIFITGATGFAGSFLTEHLDSLSSFEIIGTYQSETSLATIASCKDRVKTVQIDLLDKEKVVSILQSEKPDYIYHLAALTSPHDSFEAPVETLTNNIAAELNLLEGIRVNNLDNTRILIVSSGEIYGMVGKSDLPIDENTPLRPTSPYAVSKIAQDYLGLQYFNSHKLDIIRVRPFNHIGPRQSPNFVVSSFAKKIAEIEKGKNDAILTVGNLESKRDFTDVRDMVSSYHLIMEKGVSGEVYNIGSGKSIKIADILQMLLSLSKTKITTKEDQSLLRPSDIPELLCDNTKIVNATSWKPVIPIEKTLQDTLDYWRNIV